MSLTLLCYEDEGEPPTPPADMAHALAVEPGLDFEDQAGTPYRPFRWRHPHTGASCTGDLGELPLEEDPISPPRRYEGYREAGLAVHIPLSAPHWFCVDVLDLLGRILARLPGLLVLDTEDTLRGGGGEGPGPLDRARVLASWERLHAAQSAGRDDLPRMDRRASLALWRYRRECARARRDAPEAVWPQALALAEEGRARSASLWAEPERALALPPVELLVLQRPDGAGVLPADELRTAAGGGQPLSLSGATLIPASAAVRSLYEGARLLPAGRFRALEDQDWSD